MADLNTLTALMEEGARASFLLGPLSEELSRREAAIMARLVQLYRNHTLNGRDAMLGIAEIAGLRSLLADLNTRVRQGRAAEQDFQITS